MLCKVKLELAETGHSNSASVSGLPPCPTCGVRLMPYLICWAAVKKNPLFFVKLPDSRELKAQESLEKNNNAEFRTGTGRREQEKTRGHTMNTKKKMKYYLLIKGTWANMCTERGREAAGGPMCRSVIKNYGPLITSKVIKLRLQR